MSSSAGTGLHFWISVFLTLVLGFSPALSPMKDFKLELRGSNISKATVNLKPVWSLLGLHMILVWVEITNERESDYRSGEVARKVQWISAVTLLPCLGCVHQAQELQPWWALSFNQLFCSRREFFSENFLRGIRPPPPRWLSVEAKQLISISPIKNLNLRNSLSCWRKKWWKHIFDKVVFWRASLSLLNVCTGKVLSL